MTGKEYLRGLAYITRCQTEGNDDDPHEGSPLRIIASRIERPSNGAESARYMHEAGSQRGLHNTSKNHEGIGHVIAARSPLLVILEEGVMYDKI